MYIIYLIYIYIYIYICKTSRIYTTRRQVIYEIELVPYIIIYIYMQHIQNISVQDVR